MVIRSQRQAIFGHVWGYSDCQRRPLSPVSIVVQLFKTIGRLNDKKTVLTDFSKVSEAIAKQSSILNHVSGVYEHPKMYEYVEMLVSKMPGNLKVSQVFGALGDCVT